MVTFSLRDMSILRALSMPIALSIAVYSTELPVNTLTFEAPGMPKALSILRTLSIPRPEHYTVLSTLERTMLTQQIVSCDSRIKGFNSLRELNTIAGLSRAQPPLTKGQMCDWGEKLCILFLFLCGGVGVTFHSLFWRKRIQVTAEPNCHVNRYFPVT